VTAAPRTALRLCDENRILSSLDVGWHEQAIRNLEAIMKKEIFQDNKARWEVFEWIGSTQSKVIWAAIAVIVALGIMYLVA
jgi:hypothetical protein